MSDSMKEVSAILPGGENNEDRERLLSEIGSESPDKTDDIEDDEPLEPINRVSRKRFVLAFGMFVCGCVLMISAVSWFFGIGFFSSPPVQPVNRTAKTEGSSAPVTEEEKLRMALNMIADKPIAAPARVDTVTAPQPSEPTIDLPADPQPTSAAGIALTEPTPSDSVYEAKKADIAPEQRTDRTRNPDEKLPVTKIRDASPTELQVMGRSVFFGREKNEQPQISSIVEPVDHKADSRSEPPIEAPPIPFGSLLPIRLLGSVQTFGNTAGYVRMELTQPFEKNGKSYPAGTTLVGTLRKGESSRAFITVVGLIDPATGGLMKFSGEVLGSDGASGLQGRKRHVKSGWSRTLAGLREVGASALGAVGSWRSGGTVLITDSSQKSSAILASEITGQDKASGEFVELPAGTTGYVLVTELPKEAAR